MFYWAGISHDKIVNCPHRDAEIDEHMWGRIVDAMGTVNDVNYHFRKYHGERQEDLFEIAVENIHVPNEKFKFSKDV